MAERAEHRDPVRSADRQPHPTEAGGAARQETTAQELPLDAQTPASTASAVDPARTQRLTSCHSGMTIFLKPCRSTRWAHISDDHGCCWPPSWWRYFGPTVARNRIASITCIALPSFYNVSEYMRLTEEYQKPSDTVGEPISTLPSQLFCIGISMVLCLQRSHTRGAIFDAPEFANSSS